MSQPASQQNVQRVGDIERNTIDLFLERFGLTAEWVADDAEIPASFWGDPEAGIAGHRVYIRADTPVHSMLHEVCHVICMSSERRAHLNRDAGSDDLEESAVCYLQIVLADFIEGVGREQLMADMNAWGYSFRLGRTESWFEEDADDAKAWLVANNLLSSTDVPQFRLRDVQ
jgi:hypothetical protein